MNNRSLSPSQLQILREKAVKAVIEKHLRQKEACKMFGLSPTSMTKYMVEYRAVGNQSFIYQERGAKEGSNTKITLENMQELSSIL